MRRIIKPIKLMRALVARDAKLMRALVARDIRLAARRLGFLPLAFFLLASALLPLTGNLAGDLTGQAAAVLWVLVLLSSLLAQEQIFADDMRSGVSAVILTAPLPAPLAVLAKMLAFLLIAPLPLSVCAGLAALLFYRVPESETGWLILTLLAASPALAALAVFCASLTAGLSRGGVLASFLCLPFYIPLLIFGLAAAGGQALFWLLLISVLTFAVLPFAAAAALRAALD